MSEFYSFLSSIRAAAQNHAKLMILMAENKGCLAIGLETHKPRFSDEQKERIAKAAEQEAVGRIFSHLSSVAHTKST